MASSLSSEGTCLLVLVQDLLTSYGDWICENLPLHTRNRNGDNTRNDVIGVWSVPGETLEAIDGMVSEIQLLRISKSQGPLFQTHIFSRSGHLLRLLGILCILPWYLLF